MQNMLSAPAAGTKKILTGGSLPECRMDKFRSKKQIRLREYDYAADGIYLITICARDRECIFAVVGADRRVRPCEKNVVIIRNNPLTWEEDKNNLRQQKNAPDRVNAPGDFRRWMNNIEAGENYASVCN